MLLQKNGFGHAKMNHKAAEYLLDVKMSSD